MIPSRMPSTPPAASLCATPRHVGCQPLLDFPRDVRAGSGGWIVSFSSQNVCCDTSRDVEVKLVGERIGSSGLVSTTCSAIGGGQQRRTSRKLRTHAGMSREVSWTWREIITLISPGHLTAIPNNSKSLTPNSACRISPLNYRESEPRMC